MKRMNKQFVAKPISRLAIIGALLALPALVFAQSKDVRDWTNGRLDQGVITHSRTWWPKELKEVEPVVTPEPRPTATPAPKPPDTPTRPEITGPPIPFGELGLTQRIYFDFDKSNIRPDQEAALKKNLQYLLDNPEVGVLLEGHCDERGTLSYNIALGERRADSVRDYLIRGGVKASRIVTKSWGEELPLDFGKTEEAYAKNRRVEFYKVDIR